MPVEVKKREGENLNALLFRFNKRIKQSGVLKEAKERRFRRRGANRQKRRASAIYRIRKGKEVARLRKLGHL